jgi:hypothetical protein
MLKMRDSQAYETLKSLSKTISPVNTGKYFDWTKIPANTKFESILTLEKLQLIFTKEHSEFVFLNGRIKEVMDKLEK